MVIDYSLGNRGESNVVIEHFKASLMIKVSKQQHFKPTVQDLVSEFDIYSFNEAIHYHSHLFLGSRVIEYAGISGVQFTLWAPGLKAVSLAADFNNWTVNSNTLLKVHDSGLWSLWIPNIKAGIKYQYVLHQSDNQMRFINDPYALQVNFESRLCSVVVNDHYNWNDSTWIKEREVTEFSNRPVSILAFDLQKYYSRCSTYQELAKLFVDEAKAFGATHIELNNFLECIRNLNIIQNNAEVFAEYHYFAASNTYGAAEDFKCLVDYCHKNQIGVILSLPYFEDENFSVYGNFKNLSKNQHKNFYLSNLVFWLEEYHTDGFNFGSIESLIFKANHSEIKDFMQSMNETIHARSAGIFTIAQDTTGFPGLTKPGFMDGLGFNMKINVAWFNEMKKFFAADGFDVSDFVYSTINLFAENFVLSLPSSKGLEDLSFSDAKMLLAFFFFLPGKKHLSYNFIENLAMKLETDSSTALRFMKGYCSEESVEALEKQRPAVVLSSYLSQLNSFYNSAETLFSSDFRESGFEWLDYSEKSEQLSFIRWSKNYKDIYLVVFNFSDEKVLNFGLGVPAAGFYKQVFNSESIDYNGSGLDNSDGVYSSKHPLQNRPYSIAVDLPAEAISVFQLVR